MNAVPSIESILLQVHQSLELPAYTSKQKAAFSKLKRPLDKHREQFQEIIDGIFRALDIHDDAQACIDLSYNIENFANFQKALELKTWTFDASYKQVVWQLVSHSYIPGIARVMAYWNLENITDKGMPGGHFWYLPTETENSLNVNMPVMQVCSWLLDLLGIPLDQMREVNLKNSSSENLIRNIYNWKNGKVPRLETIYQTFPDDADIKFKGCLDLNKSFSEKDQFKQVLAFIEAKQLKPELLVHEIPLTDISTIEKVIGENGSYEQNHKFVQLMSIRYAKPTFKTIRQRLVIAKATQDGYKRLLKFLCPGVKPTCADINKNKVLQLCHIYKYIYNLTIEAYRLNHGELEENTWFDNKLPETDKNGLFLSVAPSRFSSSSSLLGELFSKRFKQMKPETPLANLFDLSPESNLDVLKQKLIEQKRWSEETIAEVDLGKQVRKGSPRRSFKQQNNYWIISQFAQNNSYSDRIKEAAIQRLYELSKSSIEEACSILLECSYLINLPKNKRPVDIQNRLASLLEDIEQHPGFDLWKAPLLSAKAKHFISLNEFKAGAQLFKHALEACEQRSYGPLKGLIARDALATLVQVEKLNGNNHERYLREMMVNNVFEIASPLVEVSLEAVAYDLNTHFWKELYKPYRGVKNLETSKICL